MDAGLLFYLARRTSACQRIISRAAALFQVEISEVRVCARENGLSGSVAGILDNRPMVFLVGAASGYRPDCSEAIFRMLRVPLGRSGEPRGVLRISGGEKSGYVIESINQAILLLPDDPYEILRMLPASFDRLKRKFGLSGEFPKAEHPDYEKLITACMEKQNPGI